MYKKIVFFSIFRFLINGYYKNYLNLRLRKYYYKILLLKEIGMLVKMNLENTDISENINNLCNEIFEIEKNNISNSAKTEIDVLKQKELLEKLIVSYSNSLRKFYENLMTAQLEILEDNYHNLIAQQRNIYESSLTEKLTQEVISFNNKIEEQKDWYENQLFSQKIWYDNEMQSQINNLTSWHLSNLNKKLDRQRDYYEKLIEKRLEDMKAWHEKELIIQAENSAKFHKVELEAELEKQRDYYEKLMASKKDIFTRIKNRLNKIKNKS